MVVFNSGTETLAHRAEHTSVVHLQNESVKTVIPSNNPQPFQLALLLLYVLKTQVSTQLYLT